jgi:hypothetical protein
MAFPSVDNIVNTVRKVCHGLKVWSFWLKLIKYKFKIIYRNY